MTGIPPISPYKIPSAPDLPPNVAQWNVAPKRAVLLVHDMQRYFVQPFNGQHRKQLIHNISTLSTRARKLDIPVAYSAQPGGMTPEQRGLLRDFWGPGMNLDLHERNIIEELTPSPEDWFFIKWRYSAFFRSGLLERMHEYGRDQLIICGIYAHIGVLSTAIDAFTNNIQTFLVADAVSDFSEKHHRTTLEYASQLCAKVCTTEDIFA